MNQISLKFFSKIRLQAPYRRCYSSSLKSQYPFDLDDTDDKYKELNSFYSDLFTQTTFAPNAQDNTAEKSELDELNEELNSLYTVNVLTPLELQDHVKNDGRFIIRSTSTNPFFNLALEEYVFRNTPLNDGPMQNERLMFYTNDRCVVIGKNQNPWKELYLRNLSQRGYEFLRRHSGGGAVVHDLGNVNYSYLTSRERFKREFFNRQLVQCLNNPDVSMNDRGDLTYKGFKISGSAFKIAQGKSYHHGTMLVESELSEFKGLLKPDSLPGIEWSCNSVESVRSEVCNIGGKVVSSIDHFCSLVSESFRTMMNDQNIPMLFCDETSTLPEIQKASNTLQSNSWKYMTGPKFSVSYNGTTISVEKGVITDSTHHELIGKLFYEFYEQLEEGDEAFQVLL